MKNKNRLKEAAYHYMVPVCCVVTAWDLFYWATPDWLNLGMVLVALPARVFCIGVGWTHGRFLCVKCIKNTPDNPENEIQRKSKLLRLHHVTMDRFWWNIGILVLLLGFAYIIQSSFSNTGWIDHMANVPLDIFVTGTMFATATHHRLNAWCPWCKGWNDDGPGITTPDPMPQGEKQR